MIGQSRQHLAATGGDYGEHFLFASTVGLMVIAVGLACLVHALIPALSMWPCSTADARHQTLLAARRMLNQLAEQLSGAITFVGLLPLASVAAAAPVLVGAQLDGVRAQL